MTGPEHYQLAERIIEASDQPGNGPARDVLLANAQVHATLALAAATAMASSCADGMYDRDWRAWSRVCGAPRQ